MKIGVLGLAVVCFSSVSGLAAAQAAPRARRGFQLALRTGYSVPFGNAEKNAKMSDLARGQVPLIADIGAKIVPEFFLGGYFGFGFGGEAGLAKQSCEANGGGCLNAGIVLGIEAQYQILPAAKADPWLGYGIGFESIAVTAGNNSGSSGSLGGLQFARFSGGVDFRVDRVFGVGPFIDLSMGKYSTINSGSESEDIAATAMHEWLTLGARFVFFP